MSADRTGGCFVNSCCRIWLLLCQRMDLGGAAMIKITNKKLKHTINTVVITLAFVFAITAAVLITKSAVGSNEKLTGQTIKQSLSSISTLNAAEYYYTHVESYDSGNRKIGTFDIPFTNSKAIYTYSGTITAGINFSEIDVNISGKTITISMPKSAITGSELDPESLKQYYEQNNMFNPMTIERFNKMLVDIQQNEETAAVESGLLDKADTNLKTLIESFVKGAYDVEGYDIVFAD